RASLLGLSAAEVAGDCDQQRDSIGSMNRNFFVGAMHLPGFRPVFRDNPNLTFEPRSMFPIAVQILPGMSIENQSSSFGFNLSRQTRFSKCDVAGKAARSTRRHSNGDDSRRMRSKYFT